MDRISDVIRFLAVLLLSGTIGIALAVAWAGIFNFIRGVLCW